MNREMSKRMACWLGLTLASILIAPNRADGQDLKPPPQTGDRVCVAVGEKKQVLFASHDPQPIVTVEPQEVAKVSVVTVTGNAPSQVYFSGLKPGLAVVRISHQEFVAGLNKNIEVKSWYYVTVSDGRISDPDVCQGRGAPKTAESNREPTNGKSGNEGKSSTSNAASGISKTDSGEASNNSSSRGAAARTGDNKKSGEENTKASSSNNAAAEGNDPEAVFRRALEYLRKVQTEMAELRKQAETELGGKIPETAPKEIQYHFQNNQDLLAGSIKYVEQYLALATKQPRPDSNWWNMKRYAYKEVEGNIAGLWVQHLDMAKWRILVLRAEDKKLYDEKFKELFDKIKAAKGQASALGERCGGTLALDNQCYRDVRNGLDSALAALCRAYTPFDLQRLQNFAERYDKISRDLLAVYNRSLADLAQWNEFAAKDGYPKQPGEGFAYQIAHFARPRADNTDVISVRVVTGLIDHCDAYRTFYNENYSHYPEIKDPGILVGIEFSMQPLFAPTKAETAKVLAVNFYQQRTPKDFNASAFSFGPVAELIVGVPVVAEVVYNVDPKVDVITVQITVAGKQLSLTARRSADKTKFRTDPFIPWPAQG